MRYTPKQLDADIANSNENLAVAGGNWFFQHGQRYGYQQLDSVYIDENGQVNNWDCVEAGSSRDCLNKLHSKSQDLHGYLFAGHGFTATRKMAKKCLTFAIDFTLDFHQLNSWQVEALLIWAKRTKYRKPQAANGSRARYFYQHLQNKVTI